MFYKLTNGESVNLRSNIEAAKFVYLVMPFKKLRFDEATGKPHITMNADVNRIMRVYSRMLVKNSRTTTSEDDVPFDDKIPF